MRADGFAIAAVVIATSVKRSFKFVLELFDLVMEFLKLVALILCWLSLVANCAQNQHLRVLGTSA
ncbi:MAG: hypothetical protein M3Q30_19645 [Actinomycetota bacterium]|nr:hypothetical protein [Actinomycetota bacterium]